MSDILRNTIDIVFIIFYLAVFILAAIFIILKYFKSDNIIDKPAVGLDKNTILKIIGVVLLSRIVLLLLSWGAVHISGYGDNILDVWNNWDAQQYLRIVNEGYISAEDGFIRIVFYPLYSAVVWLFKFIFVDARLSAMLVSWGCLCSAGIYLYKLVLLDYDKKTANRALKYLLIFPVTVFLGAPFTESMFLMLSLACLYNARIRKFSAACIFGGLAALTRNVGVLLAVPVLLEMLLAHSMVPKLLRQNIKDKLKAFAKDFPYIFIIPLGTIAYLLLNQFILGDAFGFLKIQQDYWSQSFGSYANTLSVTFGQVLTMEFMRTKLLLWASQFAVLIIGGLTLPVICKKMRVSYGAYSIVYLFVVFAPTWLLSGFRYYMGLVILFLALALLTKRKWADVVITVMFALLMPIYTYAFTMGWLVF